MAKQKINFTGYNHRYCPNCKKITPFEYDKMIRHCFCKKCTCSIGALKITKKNKPKIMNMLKAHFDKDVANLQEEVDKQVELLNKLLSQVKTDERN